MPRWRRPATWLWAVLALPLLALALAAVLATVLALGSANWARAPLEQLVQLRTGRALHIDGDLHLQPGWPLLGVQVQGLRFANPGWARQPQLLAIDRADAQLDLRALLRGRLLLPQVQVGRPVVLLERAADGRKSWLLDRAQADAGSAVQIGSLTLREGTLGYDDPRDGTSLRLVLDATGRGAGAAGAPQPGPTSALGGPGDVLFSASGTLRGQPVQLRGRGGAALGLHGDGAPYPLLLEGQVGSTTLRADGRVTGLARLTAVDVRLALRGDNLARLGALLGLGLPQTPAYAGSGRLLHQGSRWQYQGFSGQVGRSDVAGNLTLDLGGPRPRLHGDIANRLLDLADLGPVLGLGGDTPAGRLLPDLPIRSAGWHKLDADLHLSAQHVVRSRQLPLDSIATRLLLQDGVLALQALDLGSAGGHLTGSLELDARQPLLQASASLQAQGLQLTQLLAVAEQARAGSGRLHGRAELRGQGATLGALLGSASGSLVLAAEPGRISRLLMERLGLHLLEMLQLSLTGDQPVTLRCAVADFGLQQGVMTARTLALDTPVSSVVGSGHIDLGRQTLDLTLVPHARKASLVALRGPIRLHGPLAAPQVQLDTGAIVARGAGALALGLVNPLLALAPLVDTGKDTPSPCGKAVAQAALSALAASAPAPRAAPAAPRSGTRAGTAPPAPSPSRP